MTPAQAEQMFPILDLFLELERMVKILPLEDNVVDTKLELIKAIDVSEVLAVKPNHIPRYDLFHNVYNFIKIRIDAPINNYSPLLKQWSSNYYYVIPLYDFRGIQ